MHITTLVCIQLTTYYEYSPSQFVLEKQPSVFNLRTFGCIVYEPITPTQLTKIIQLAKNNWPKMERSHASIIKLVNKMRSI